MGGLQQDVVLRFRHVAHAEPAIKDTIRLLRNIPLRDSAPESHVSSIWTLHIGQHLPANKGVGAISANDKIGIEHSVLASIHVLVSHFYSSISEFHIYDTLSSIKYCLPVALGCWRRVRTEVAP